jgi:chromosome segregation ATPase
MGYHTFEDIHSQLDEVGKFIKFGRQKIVLSLKQSFCEFENYFNSLKSKLFKLETDIKKLESVKYSQTTTISELEESQTLLNDQLAKKQYDFSVLLSKSVRLESHLKEWQTITESQDQTISELEEKNTLLSKELSKKRNEFESLQNDFNLLKSKSAQLEAEIKELESIKDSQSTTISELEEKNTLLNKELSKKRNEFESLQNDFNSLKSKSAQLEAEIAQLEAEIKELEFVKEFQSTTILELEEKNTLLNKELQKKRNEFESLQNEFNSLQSTIARLDSKIRDLESVKKSQIKNISELEKTKSLLLEELRNKHEELINKSEELAKKHCEFDNLQKTHQIITTQYDLVSRILAAKSSDNEAMEKFKNLFNNDFMNFANEESSLAEEAKAVLILQSVEKQLQMIINFAGMYEKNIIAVGGGFGAGKSEFISSFFKDKTVKLPIGIKPVTAIPTYITQGNSHIIKGYSREHGAIDIAPELYKQLSHDFVKSFAFNLKEIMPVMAIETLFECYKHICFVDTPGYNPSNTDGFTENDLSTAQEYLEQSNTLLWLIGVDTHGTIPASDLKFLENLTLENKKLYIVANKSDLRSADDLEDILDEFEQVLDDYDIEYEGISAFSSVQRKEVFNRKISLYDFLQQQDHRVEVHEQIRGELNSVFDMYKDAINYDIQRTEKIQGSLKSLELDLLESGYDLNDDRVNNRFDDIRGMFETKSLKKLLKELKKIREMMTKAVNEIFKSIG